MMMHTETSFDWDEPGDFLDGTFFPADLLSDVLQDIDVVDDTGRAAVYAKPDPDATPSAASSVAPVPTNPKRTATSASSSSSSKRAVESESNSAACRRYRNRRRAETQELRVRNAELENARHDYLSRIAELQLDLQTVRACGGVDLAKENELLRAEIRKHKGFVHSIVSATQSVPAVLPEEQARLIRAGMDSGVGQVVGLLYTSSTWRRAPSVELAPGRRAHALFQLLPEGSHPASAKRINLRVDFGTLPCSAAKLDEFIWRQCTDVDALNALMLKSPALLAAGVRARHEPVAPALTAQLAADLGMEMSILRYVEEAKETKPPKRGAGAGAGAGTEGAPRIAKEAVHALSRAARDLSPRSFLLAPYAGAGARVCADGGESELDHAEDIASAAAALAELEEELAVGPAACSVFCAASCAKSLAGANLLPEPLSEAQQLAESMIKGQVVTPHASDADKCYMVSVMSLPIGFFSGFSSSADFVDEQGRLSALTQAIFAAAWRSSIEPCLAAE